MDGNVSNEESGNIDWDTDDELEIQNVPLSSSSSFSIHGGEVIAGNGEGCSSAGSSNSRLINHFVGMGFTKESVLKAIQENGEAGNSESILETLLLQTALENSPEQQQQCVNSDQCSSGYDEGFLDDFSDSDSWCGSEIVEIPNSSSEEEKKLLSLANMGYTVEEASIAMDRCGPTASIAELTDFICAAQMAKAADVYFQELPDESKPKLTGKKRIVRV